MGWNNSIDESALDTQRVSSRADTSSGQTYTGYYRPRPRAPQPLTAPPKVKPFKPMPTRRIPSRRTSRSSPTSRGPGRSCAPMWWWMEWKSRFVKGIKKVPVRAKDANTCTCAPSRCKEKPCNQKHGAHQHPTRTWMQLDRPPPESQVPQMEASVQEVPQPLTPPPGVFSIHSDGRFFLDSFLRQKRPNFPCMQAPSSRLHSTFGFRVGLGHPRRTITLSKFSELLGNGLLGGVWSAPPCREYSRLKLRPGGPPALRTPEEPEGKANLSALQTLQLQEQEEIHHRGLTNFVCSTQPRGCGRMGNTSFSDGITAERQHRYASGLECHMCTCGSMPMGVCFTQNPGLCVRMMLKLHPWQDGAHVNLPIQVLQVKGRQKGHF